MLNHDLDGDRTIVGLMDLGGWGGDLISALGDFANSGLPDDQAYGFAIEHIASYADAGFFTFADFLADVDAMVFGLKCKTDPSLMLSTLFRQYYATSTGSVVRFGEFVSLRFGSRDNMLAAAANMFSQITDLDLLLYREGLWRRDFGDNFPAIELERDDRSACRRGRFRCAADADADHRLDRGVGVTAGRVRDQGQELTVLLETAHRQHRGPSSTDTLLTGRGIRK